MFKLKKMVRLSSTRLVLLVACRCSRATVEERADGSSRGCGGAGATGRLPCHGQRKPCELEARHRQRSPTRLRRIAIRDESPRRLFFDWDLGFVYLFVLTVRVGTQGESMLGEFPWLWNLVMAVTNGYTRQNIKVIVDQCRQAESLTGRACAHASRKHAAA